MAKSDMWETPPDLMAVLMAEFKFTLEVCADANRRAIPAIPYMGLDNGQDALQNDWGQPGDVIYCNPPYSQLPAFTTRALEMYKGSRDVVLLIPAYTDTLYWWNNIAHGADVRFLKGRLRFWQDGAAGKDTARFPSAVCIYRTVYGKYRGLQKGWALWDWRDAGE